MNKCIAFIAAGIAAALIAGMAIALSSISFAEEPVRTRVIMHAPPEFSEVDADGDGMVTEAEFLAFIEAHRAAAAFPFDGEKGGNHFARADVDGDGVLSREEFEAAPRKIIRHTLQPRDPKELFEQADTNRDSVLDEQEFKALFGTMRGLRKHTARTDEQEGR